MPNYELDLKFLFDHPDYEMFPTTILGCTLMVVSAEVHQQSSSPPVLEIAALNDSFQLSPSPRYINLINLKP